MLIQYRTRAIVLILAIVFLGVPQALAQTVAPPPGVPIAPPDIPIDTTPANPPLIPPPGVTPPSNGCTLFSVPPAFADDGPDPENAFYYVNCIVEDGELVPGDTPPGDTGLEDNVITFYNPVPPSSTPFVETKKVEQQNLNDEEYDLCDFSLVVDPTAETMAFDVTSYDEDGNELPSESLDPTPLIVSTLNPTILLACDPATGDITFIPQAEVEDLFTGESDEDDLPSSTFIVTDFDLVYLLVDDISA